MTMIKRSPLTAFTLITFIFSWGFWLPQALYSQGYIEIGNILWGFGSFGPSIAGIIVIALTSDKAGLKTMWLRLLDLQQLQPGTVCNRGRFFVPLCNA